MRLTIDPVIVGVKEVSTMPSHTASRTPHLTLCELEDPSLAGLESLSPFCLKVHRALKLARLPYERRHGGRPADFRRHNPTGQVPVLLIDGKPVCDSTAILRRIVALEPLAFDAGADDRARGERWLWEEMADSVLSGYLVAARWADDRNWGAVSAKYFAGAPWFVRAVIAPRIRARVVGGLVARDVWRAGADACWGRFVDTLDDLEARAPLRGFWLGASPGVADVALSAQLASLRTELTPWQSLEVEKRPRLVDWLDRVALATSGARADRSTTAAATPPVNAGKQRVAHVASPS
jgi:glutathione S-transferase